MMQTFFSLARQELALTLILFTLLFIRIGTDELSPKAIINLVNGLLLLNFLLGLLPFPGGMLFNDMFRTGALQATEKNMLNLGMLIISLQSYHWLIAHRHLAECYILLLSSLLGMFLMISAGNLMMFYLALEMGAIPLAALVNFDLHKRQSSEAALKFVISSAFASGMLLFGISFLYGSTGTLVFAELPGKLTGNPIQLFALVLIIAGFGFKISAAPFHLWTADVYEGAPVAITAYLSVISKGAAVFVLVNVLYTMMKPLSAAWYPLLYVLSIVTMLTGNLFALRQTRIKRLLAFSSIAQAGFILAGISGSTREGMAATVYFILVYVFSNLGAFGVVAVVSALTGKEETSDYTGLYTHNRALTWIMALSLFSLAGIPPLAGFFGKFFLVLAAAGKGNYSLVLVAALNMVLSLYYYLNVVRMMFSRKEGTVPLPAITLHRYPYAGLLICVIGMLVAGMAGSVYGYIFSISLAG